MPSNEELNSVVSAMGGKENITDFFHCATRLRFNLKDPAEVDVNALKALPGVIAVVQASGQCQLIVGNKVAAYYQSLRDFVDEQTSDGSDTTNESSSKEKLLSKLLAFISGSFLPLIGLMAGAGLIKAVVSLLSNWHYFDGSETLKILSFIGDVPFFFLPVLLGFTLARKLKSSEVIGATIGAALLYPEFTALVGQQLHFLSLPLWVINYGGTVFPVMFAVMLAWKIEQFLKRVVPDSLQLFAVPMLCLIIVLPVTLLALGPVGTYLGQYIAKGAVWLISIDGILSGIVIGALYSYIVLLGLHWALIPVLMANIMNGGDPIFAMGGMSAVAQMGVALGIMIKTDDQKTRQLASSSVFPALFSGVTEPILYGLIMPYKKALLFILISGATGGAINGYFHVLMQTFAFSSLLAIPTANNYGVYASAFFTTLITGALLVIVFGYKSKNV
ncbi:PTS transporter subunit EIIC [Salmonella enterica]